MGYHRSLGLWCVVLSIGSTPPAICSRPFLSLSCSPFVAFFHCSAHRCNALQIHEALNEDSLELLREGMKLINDYSLVDEVIYLRTHSRARARSRAWLRVQTRERVGTCGFALRQCFKCAGQLPRLEGSPSDVRRGGKSATGGSKEDPCSRSGAQVGVGT